MFNVRDFTAENLVYLCEVRKHGKFIGNVALGHFLPCHYLKIHPLQLFFSSEYIITIAIIIERNAHRRYAQFFLQYIEGQLVVRNRVVRLQIVEIY